MTGAGAVQSPRALGAAQPRHLYWLKGMKLDVQDEKGEVMPTAEFICHANLDISPAAHNEAFPEGERCRNERILSLTQGQTDLFFPSGVAVPLASDEVVTLTFQAANRTTDDHRRVRHRCTLTFIKDTDLVYPITALSWYVPYITVITDRNSPEARELEKKAGPHCMVSSVGVNAPNSVPGAVVEDELKRRVTGHWVVPPGEHTYATVIGQRLDPGFGMRDRIIHFAWTHIHPLCTRAGLVPCGSEKPVFESRVKTDTSKGLQIVSIGTISSEDGIKLPKGQYELRATYENRTGEAVDSMVSHGIFFADTSFARPRWVLTGKTELFCGIKSAACPLPASEPRTVMTSAPARSTTDVIPPYPAFDQAKDGPLLTQTKRFEMETTAGPIRIELDPALAPAHATQVHKLLKLGAYEGTTFYRYEAGFVLQLSPVDVKAAGRSQLPAPAAAALRRMPLEVEVQTRGTARHEKWMLSMARYDRDDTAVSSFCLMLGAAPHLDRKYTVFGRVITDAATVETVNRLAGTWSDSQLPWIVRVRELIDKTSFR